MEDLLKQEAIELEDLLKQKAELEAKIQATGEAGVEKILRAIENQRWYFFQNKPKIIFDRSTGLIWADLKYFPYGRGNGYSGDKAKSVIRDSQNWGGYNGWKIPTAAEFWQMIEDKTFPYHSQRNSS